MSPGQRGGFVLFSVFKRPQRPVLDGPVTSGHKVFTVSAVNQEPITVKLRIQSNAVEQGEGHWMKDAAKTSLSVTLQEIPKIMTITRFFFLVLPKKEMSVSFPPLAVSAAATPFATYHEAVKASPVLS
jgi:hypothetical protein